MHVHWSISPLADWQAEAILFFTFEDSRPLLPGFVQWLDSQPWWQAELTPLRDFKGKHQETSIYYGPRDHCIARVICVGLGPAEKFDREKLRNAAAVAVRKCRELRISHPALPLPALQGLPLDGATALREALIGAETGLYRYGALKTRNDEPDAFPETLCLLAGQEPGDDLQEALNDAQRTARGICLARDLVVAPANIVTPRFLADKARELAHQFAFQMQLIDLDAARRMGMGLFTAVAQGSREPAYMIVLEHRPRGTEEDRPLVLIGKGITFDAGGISIKPSSKMELMKHDMAGAAAILGAFQIIGEMKLARRIVGILPCTENMPDGKAYKPGDVLRSMSGVTVEVISTDAEGRLILGDALAYALDLKPCAMVDIATLTGACIVALGDRVGAVMGNEDALVAKIQEIGMQVGDRLWPLPQWDFYFDDLKSDVADFKNVGERKGGAIVAGIFLKQFVPDHVPWAHLDIAGPAWTEKDLVSAPKGATGFGVRLLVDLARRWHPTKQCG
ncbi:leucyl aminopeptidase [Desulfoferrobacter suflitae]|uniref:leucyl aminopeptidase n=1 Tax=Desulfoferrobacter suflitae TaxID=2865782 RepID=UPI0021646958|nr:leucyl aminopeptidase [Desulfoferrobacter suflitae]MCK8600818.1 leucyl aminopeptidase [Desulfoferrobacter suflitae]